MKSIKIKIIISFILLLFGFFVTNSPILAFMEWPNSPIGTSLNVDSKLPVLIQYLYEWGITLGGLAVFISLIISGTQYLSSFGNPTSMKDAMDRIKSAFLGLILLLSSWLILNTINPNLTNFQSLSLNLEDVKSDFGACDVVADCDKYKAADSEREYLCEEGFCTEDFDAAVKPKYCDYIIVKWTTTLSSGEEKITKNNFKSVTIPKGAKFSIEGWKDTDTKPSELCVASIGLYSNIKTGFLGFGTGCSKDSESQNIYLMKDVERDDLVANQIIKCIEFQEY
ncbi:MAG: hypothetical protein ABID67_00300 [Candidatus Nealsonbacteria bacterium]